MNSKLGSTAVPKKNSAVTWVNLLPSEAIVSSLKRFSWSTTFTALKYPNFRLWFWGQMFSLMGTWMQSTAQGYLIYDLTRSPALLGVVGFAAGLPFWLFNFIGGGLTDRMSRRTILVITQSTMMLLAFILGGLVFSGLVQPWHIVLLAFGNGIANAFDAPARMAFMPEMVEHREDYSNAIALNSTFVNLAAVVGPAAAGLIYAWVGPAWCFMINALSFLAVIAALLLMRLKPFRPPVQSASMLAHIKEGFRYVLHTPAIRILILMVMVTSVFGHSYITLLPAWAVNILGGDSRLYGLMQSFRGAGALMAALMVASLGRINIKGKLLTLGSFLFPLVVIAWAFIRNIPISLLLIALSGVGFMLLLNMSNTLIQMNVSDELRGRVMGMYTFAFFGMMPLGSLLGGALAEWLAEPGAVIIGGTVSLIMAIAVFFYYPYVREMK